MFGLFDVSTSALVAQRTRMDAIAGNVANAFTAGRIDGEGPAPYRRRAVLFEAGDGRGGAGVHVSEVVDDPNPPRAVKEPGHPFADRDGMVYYPNVDLATEMIDGMMAARAFEANITAIEATKSMLASTLRILA
ncbi:MAG: flagellar basal body rod protein FlgC [Phycisphaerae bacterium]|nr:flagellar basal body rod protein FlgC [Phycisphaerae bacterium]